ncbi:YXWGXW repeat-containing protein [Nevskia soli]|uniref:YXWGXW repeat-containing protein n=1 Tax=Nevskia soli TaxID=418856 RepID=UPI000691ECF5|nr:YXWGXW repeat-containing protein [Nevskia soli]
MPYKLGSLALALALFAAPGASFAQIGISITIAPPELQDYEQPVMPGDGYIWTPGYWAYGDEGYYWVAGAWVMPPSEGVLWTPGYWVWNDGAYAWNRGYWGPHIGFYGGVNYGHGYGGRGYDGGRWNNGRFDNNRAVNNIGNGNVHNTYNERVNNSTVNRVSFNGGSRGTHAAPSGEERSMAQEHHVDATAEQSRHEQEARGNHGGKEGANHERPADAGGGRPEARGPAAMQRPTAVARPQAAPAETRVDHEHAAGAMRPQAQPDRPVQPRPAVQPRPEQQPHPVQASRPPQQSHPQPEQRPQQQQHPQQAQRPQQQAQPQQESHQQPQHAAQESHEHGRPGG